MQDSSDWKKRAEAEHKRERKDIEQEGKSGLALYVVFGVLWAVVFGVVHIAEWMFRGGKLLPSSFGVGMAVLWFVGALAFGYISERHEKATSIREERLIRLEMKLDTLLNRHDQR
jgi:hypothetical protein